MHPKTDFRPSNRWWNPNADRAKGGFQWQNHDPNIWGSKAFKSIQKLKSLGTWINMTIHFIAILITKRYYLSVTIESIEASHAFEWDRGTDRHRIPWPVDLSLMLKIRILHAPWFVASCWEMFHLVKSRKNFNGIQWNVGHRHHGNAVYEKRTQNNRVWIVPALSEAWFHGEIIR